MNIFSSYTYLTSICVYCSYSAIQSKPFCQDISYLCSVYQQINAHTHELCDLHENIRSLKGIYVYMRTCNKKTYILKFRGGGE